MYKRQQGFTIIELLIATAVFSVVLLTISAAIIQIGRIYYKGVTSAQTQDAARALVDGVGRVLQFNTGEVVQGGGLDNAEDPFSHAICIDNNHYSFRFGQQNVSGKHAMLLKTVPGGCVSERAQDLSTNGPFDGEELLGDHMRLANFEVKQLSNPRLYKIIARVVYGDDELLCSPSVGNCGNTATMSPAEIEAARDLSCRNIRSGTQFCAVSELSTIVERRLE